MHLFTYGTLAVPEVMTALTGLTFIRSAAELRGYACFLLKNRIYPGVTPRQGFATPGIVYFNLDDRTLQLIDEFEDDTYLRQPVRVFSAAGHALSAEAYVIPPERDGMLSAAPWDEAAFRRRHLPEYIELCERFSRSGTDRGDG